MKKLNMIGESLTFPISRWLYFSVFCCFNSTVLHLCKTGQFSSPLLPSSCPLFYFFRGFIVYEFLSFATTFSIVVYEFAGIFMDAGEIVHSTGLYRSAFKFPLLLMRARAC